MEYTQKTMRGELKCFTIASQLNSTKDGNTGNKGQKAIRPTETNSKMTNKFLLIDVFNVNRLNSPNKRHEIGKKIQLHAVFRKLTFDPKTQQIKNKERKNLFHKKSNRRRAEMSVEISQNIDFKSKILQETWDIKY